MAGNAAKEEVQSVIKRLVEDGVIKGIEERFSEMQARQLKSVADLMGGVRADRDRSQENIAAKAIIAFANNGCDVGRALNAVKKAEKPNERVIKALGSDTGAGGGFLVDDELSPEVFDKLRARSVIRASGPIIVPLTNGTLTMSGLAVGATGGWQGENTDTTFTTETFRDIVLRGKQFGALIAVSNTLLRRGGPMVERLINNDLTISLALSTDIAYIRADGSSFQPTGLKSRAGTLFNANATINVTTVKDDLIKAINTLEQADIQMTNPGWLFAPRTKNFLMGQLDDNNNFVYRDEILRGELFGIQFKLTTQIPVNLGGGGDESEIYLVDFDNVILGDETDIQIRASETAAYNNGSTVIAAFSQDQTAIRALITTDIHVRHPETVVVIEQVKWIN